MEQSVKIIRLSGFIDLIEDRLPFTQPVDNQHTESSIIEYLQVG